MVPSQPGSPAWPGCLPLGDQPPIASPKNVFWMSFPHFLCLIFFISAIFFWLIQQKFATCVAQLPALGRTASDCLEHHWERPQMTTLLMDGSGPNGPEPLILFLQC